MSKIFDNNNNKNNDNTDIVSIVQWNSLKCCWWWIVCPISCLPQEVYMLFSLLQPCIYWLKRLTLWDDAYCSVHTVNYYHTAVAAWGLCAPLFHEHARLGFLLPLSFGAPVSFKFPSRNWGIVFRQKQMVLKKRQWHVTHGSQQPDWGKQLCESWEHFGKVGTVVTLGGGERDFGTTGTTFFFWIGKENIKKTRTTV